MIREDARRLQQSVGVLAAGAPVVADLFAAARERCVTLTFCNPLSLRVARHDPAYIDALAHFDRVHADGILLAALATRLRGVPVVRLSFDGNSLAAEVLRVSAAANVPVALVGGREGVALRAAATLTTEAGIRVVFHCHGYFAGDADVDAAIAAIRASGAGLVVVGMGAGAQEAFINRLRGSGWHGLATSCGGYLDQVAAGGSARYYPHWVNALHLRAPWRLLHEPRRLLPRYSIGYWPFYVAACRLLLARRSS